MNKYPFAWNPEADRYKERYAQLPENVQKRLDEMDNWSWKEHQLLALKKSKKRPETGDVFVFSPKEGLYFFGKVLVGKINHKTKDSFIHENCLVFLFRCKSTKKDMVDFHPDYDNLLANPMIIQPFYWRKGYLETIGHQVITEEEKKLDYGFFSTKHQGFLREDGTPIAHQPKIFGSHGISTIIAIASACAMECIIDPSLLEI